jgi:hypothetical protein
VTGTGAATVTAAATAAGCGIGIRSGPAPRRGPTGLDPSSRPAS